MKNTKKCSIGLIFHMIFFPEQASQFFFNDTATTEIYTLSLHDALPILGPGVNVIVTPPIPCPFPKFLWPLQCLSSKTLPLILSVPALSIILNDEKKNNDKLIIVINLYLIL